MNGAGLHAAPTDPRTRLAAAVAASPRDAGLRRSLAAALAQAGESRAALDQYRELLKLRPNDPDAAADAGLIARRCGREEELLPIVRHAATAHPNHVRVWQVLGLMHRSLDQLEPAIEALERCAQLVPTDPLVAHTRARVHFEAGQPASAYFERARSLAPRDKAVLNGQVAALVAERRTEEAVEALRAELGRDAGWVPGYAALTRLLWELGEKEAASEPLEAAISASPRNVDLWRELIVSFIHAGALGKALEAIARGRAAAGPHPVFDANEASCRSDLGDYAAADALYAKLGTIADPSVSVHRVRHLLRTRRLEEAERIATSMVRTPSARDFWPYLSVIWRMSGNSRWEWLEGDPRWVGTYDIGSSLPSLEDLAECLRRLHVFREQPLEQSLRGGTQSDGYLFSRVEPEIQALRKAVVDAVRTHIAQLPKVDPQHPQYAPVSKRIWFSGAWSVRLTSGGNHINHVHPAGWFSSAFYAALPSIEDRGPEPAGWLTLGEPSQELNLELPPFRMIEPKAGRLALFPSIMWHGTRPFERGERLTVAFDVARPQADN